MSSCCESSEELAKRITQAVRSKSIRKVESSEEAMNSMLIFHFYDGTQMKIEYDWIYECEIIEPEPIEIPLPEGIARWEGLAWKEIE